MSTHSACLSSHHHHHRHTNTLDAPPPRYIPWHPHHIPSVTHNPPSSDYHHVPDSRETSSVKHNHEEFVPPAARTLGPVSSCSVSCSVSVPGMCTQSSHCQIRRFAALEAGGPTHRASRQLSASSNHANLLRAAQGGRSPATACRATPWRRRLHVGGGRVPCGAGAGQDGR